MADEILQPSPPDVVWLTLDELKAQLYITHAWDDAALTQLITEASTAIALYLHPRVEATWVDPTTVPADVKQAVKHLATAYWRDRGDDPQGTAKTVWDDIDVLLKRRRDPVLA